MKKLLFVLATCSLVSQVSFAADKKAAPAATTPAATDDLMNAERVNTDAIREKYWARGDESEVGVVQNRTYSKSHKVELQIIGGLLNNDPFVSTRALGGRLGFHFNEYFSAHILAWKAWASPSSAQTNLLATETVSQIGTALNGNYAKGYYGAEGQASLIYGKLSVFGKAIVYYDLHLLVGLGLTSTESGNDMTESFGIGQQFFLSKRTSLLIDYRYMHYQEQLLNKVVPTEFGQPVGDPRSNWTGAITVGVGFLFGGDKK